MTQLHPITPGLWCVPSALLAITGRDPLSVIHPALNRHGVKGSLLGLVTGVMRPVTLTVLDELGYRTRRYRGEHEHSRVETWANRTAARYPGRVLLLFTRSHALVAQDGRVYDSWAPHGPPGREHPYAKTPVEAAYLVEPRS